MRNPRQFGSSTSQVVARQPFLDLEVQPTDLLALYSAATLDRFIQQTFRMLPQAVQCAYVSAFYQPAGGGFLKERDSRGRVWDRAFMRRYIELTPAIPLVSANPGVRILATRFTITASELDLHRTPFYNEVMKRQGWRHGVALCFWAAPSASFPIFVLTLYRTEGQPDFNDLDLAILDYLHTFLAPVVRRFHEVSASDAVSEGIATALRHVSPGVVVLDCELRAVRTTAAGRRLCAEWNRASLQGRVKLSRTPLSVPGCLLQVCHELRQELTAAMRRGREATARRGRSVAHPDCSGLTASVTAVCLATALAEPSFVIEFQDYERSPSHVADMASLLTHLTKSERAVASVVAEGFSNEEAAERLGKTIHAVKFLLHRTYQKLGVPNRSRLSLLLRGQSSV